MTRISFNLFFLFSVIILYACAGPAATTNDNNEEAEEADVSRYPSWFGNESVAFEDSLLYAYATAIDTDSAASVNKAVDWAETELKSNLSERLETIRSEAVSEEGDNRLESSAFILAMRKADNGVEDIVSVSQSEVRSVEGYESYRSYVELSGEKEKLLDYIREQMSAHQETWQIMENSEAFQQF